MLNSGTYIAIWNQKGNKNYMDVSKTSKNRGKPPKMDGENIMEQTIKMDDLGGFPIFLDHTHISH